MPIKRTDITVVKKYKFKHGFYKLDFKMPHASAEDGFRKKTSTMFPDAWSLRKIQKIINKGYPIAIKRGNGENILIPLNEIVGNKNFNGIKIQYWMNGGTKQPYVHGEITW